MLKLSKAIRENKSPFLIYIMKIGKMSNIEYTVDLSIFFAKRIPIFVDFAVELATKLNCHLIVIYTTIVSIRSLSKSLRILKTVIFTKSSKIEDREY